MFSIERALMFDILHCISSLYKLCNIIFFEQYGHETNLVFSAYGAHAIMSILNNGAIGYSEREYTKLLAGQNSSKEIKSELNDFHKNTLNTFKKIKHSDSAKFLINNFIFYENGETLLSEYESVLKTYYDVHIKKIDFDVGFVDEIENFVNEKINNTKTKIPNIDLILLNTVSFSGKWQVPFDIEKTSKQYFYTTLNGNMLTDMMYVKGEFMYFEDEECEIVRMNYIDENFFMLFILPSNNACIQELFSDFCKNDKLKNILNNLNNEEISVSIPKFKFSSNNTLKSCFDVLKYILPNSQQGDELTKIVKNYLNDIIVTQRTYISIDEIQTETKDKFENYSEMYTKDKLINSTTINFNKGFMFFLMHENIQENIFPLITGIINNPQRFD